MERFTALIGFFAILAIAWALSTNRKAIKWRTVGWGLMLQIVIAILVLKGREIAAALSMIALPLERYGAALLFIGLAIVVGLIAKFLPPGPTRRAVWGAFAAFGLYLFLTFNLLAYIFEKMKEVVNSLIGYTKIGAVFVFGKLGDGADPSIGFIFATQVLPTIIFIASIFAVLYYIGVMQLVVTFFAKLMSRFMGASGAESTSVAASIFMGQTEAPLTIRPFLPRMTRSELMTVMTAGMAHVSGSIMAAYIAFGIEARHLLTAVIMTAPGTIMMAKILEPETEVPETLGGVKVDIPRTDVNVLDAASRGTGEGLHLMLNVIAMLISFIALIALVNGLFGWIHGFAPWFPETLQTVLGWIFRPIAWVMGVPWHDSGTVGALLGERMVVNEFVAYAHLGPMKASLDPVSFTIATFALCGFANLSSIGIQIGGIGALAPDRKHDLARLGFRAMIAGTLANFLSATLAGILL